MKSDEVYELFGDMSFSYFYEKITLKDKRYGGQMLKEINRDISIINHFICHELSSKNIVVSL